MLPGQQSRLLQYDDTTNDDTADDDTAADTADPDYDDDNTTNDCGERRERPQNFAASLVSKAPPTRLAS